MSKQHPQILPDNLPPRGLKRAQAAAWLSVSTTTFDKMVRDGRMPRARRIDGRVVWDLRELEVKFDQLPHDGEDAANPWDNNS
ncbi:MAG: hypothetical protein JKY94_01605 [Rhodobacteraceae bacterium]|nr:hypothetical protein [Paracoccaceae bacterium]